MTVDKSPEKIQKMFDTISDKYDFMNNIMSFGTHFLIKKDCVNQLKSGEKILDLCCGTGDLTRILKEKHPNAEIFGVDFSEKMLEIAKRKAPTLPSPVGRVSERQEGVKYLQSNITNLPFEDNSFDIITIGFGLRNIENFDDALSEIYRVLKKDGQFMHLDFGEKNFLNKMFDKIILNLVNIFMKNNEAYSYLVKSKQEFFAPDELIKIFEQKEFKFLKRKDYFLGAISCQIMGK
ncbi:ubiquinone/menaquinone biosynthesis methyltransferase [bacterium]|nr:ubiquinone/menaquinone biosynthesis methyltransferase [bacterium]